MPKPNMKPATVKIEDSPTKERRRQNGGVVSEIIDRDVNDTVLVKRYKAVWECPLDTYKDLGVINEPQHHAGISFRQAYHLAVLCRKAAHERINLNISHTGLTKSESLLKQAYKILPPYYRPIIIDICGHDESATSEIELLHLKEGLKKLSNYWNMAAMEVCE